MVKVRLTKARVERSKTEGIRSEFWDTDVMGFGLRVSKNGHKTWVVMEGLDSNLRRTVIGQYPDMALPEAREIAKELIEAAKDRNQYWSLPGVARRAEQRKLEEERLKHATFERAARDYMRLKSSTLRSGPHVDLVIRRELIPLWGDRPLPEITSGDLLDLTDTYLDAGRPAAANKRFEIVRQMFNWFIERRLYGIDRSPCDRMPNPARRVPRSRVLNEKELIAVWHAAESYGYPFGPFTHLLMILGQRRGEVAKSTWGEFDLNNTRWTIPAEKAKPNRLHHCPLPRQAVSLLKNLPHRGRRRRQFVFSTLEGRRPIGGLDRVKNGLMKRSGVPGWTFQDLRRTMRTNLPRLKVEVVVAELAINHAISGLQRIYDQYAYYDEKAEALQKWADELERIVGAPR